MKPKKALLPLALTLCLASSSCLGPNHLFNALNNWNAEMAERNWINELVFIPLAIFIYPIAWTGDVLIFNTLGYWTGNYLIDDPGDFPGFTRE